MISFFNVHYPIIPGFPVKLRMTTRPLDLGRVRHELFDTGITGDINQLQPIGADADRIQNVPQITYLFIYSLIAGLEMAIIFSANRDKNLISADFKSF